ncbi:nuclear RNA export factor 1-like [Amia ocellicauda]|uniref:nuclear RNA export factor 1-like n=1 Tax=Amia ocellicauda TaxID=2972642 RepID=UPI003463C45E
MSHWIEKTDANRKRDWRGQQYDDRMGGNRKGRVPKRRRLYSGQQARGQQRHRGGARGLEPRARLEEDSGQNIGVHHRRFTAYGGRPNHFNRNRGGSDNAGRNRPGSWYKMTIPYGRKLEKSWLLTALQDLCTVHFTPVQFHYEGNRAVFYVQDATTALALRKVSREITDTEGYKVSIYMKHAPPPTSALNDLKPDDQEHLKGSYVASEETQSRILRFLQDYYSVFDSGHREPLLDAYDNSASFTLSTSQNPFRCSLGESSRDIDSVTYPTTHYRMLKQTPLNVVAFLSKLPKTQHDASSFVVDVNACTETLLSFTVSGVFKEVDGKCQDTMRAFSRVFTTVPAANSGLHIVNDKLFVRDATTEEIRRAFATSAPMPSSSAVPTLTATQQEMLSIFSMQSGMKLDWSQKCLQDNEWDFNRAAQIFTQLKAQGTIPDVAFK